MFITTRNWNKIAYQKKNCLRKEKEINKRKYGQDDMFAKNLLEERNETLINSVSEQFF